MWIARALPARKSDGNKRLRCRQETPRARKTPQAASVASCRSTIRKKMEGRASFGRRRHHALVHFRFAEQPEQVGVNFVGLYTFVQDAESTLDGNRAFVGPVGSRQRIENIADGH